jgi:hypothetical protein
MVPLTGQIFVAFHIHTSLLPTGSRMQNYAGILTSAIFKEIVVLTSSAKMRHMLWKKE